MKVLRVFFTLCVFLAGFVAAWEKEDHEIFDIVSELEAAEGKGTTFYSWLDLPSTATTSEISKAYRKKSMLLHPDKNPNVKGIQKRFARLGVIATILRDAESRKRYDFFYKNGVPKWRGTGYYYARFRPGLGTVFTFLILLTSCLQYLVQRLNYQRDLKRIEDIISKAKAAAYGPKMVPLPGQKKVRVNLGEARDDEGYYAGDKMVSMVVEGGEVFLVEAKGDLIKIDKSTATPPSFGRTWFVELVNALYFKVVSKKTSTSSSNDDEDDFADLPALEPPNGSQAPDVDSSEGDDIGSRSGTSTPRNGNGNGVAMPTAKAGGMRRKNVRKRK